MFNENAAVADSVSATVQTTKGLSEGVRGGGVFTFQCFDKNGNLKWEEKTHNLVVNEGLNYMNDSFFTGSGYNATFYLGLVTGPGAGNTYAATDTLANLGISLGWTEFSNYSGSRPSPSFGSAAIVSGSSDISNSPTSFFITGAGGTIAGAFLCTVATGTSGTLFSVSNFAAPGDRTVVAADTLNVTYTFTLTP